MSSYTIRYFLAQDTYVEVNGVEEFDFLNARSILKRPNEVLEVSGNTKKRQLIPVRNILCVETEEEAI